MAELTKDDLEILIEAVDCWPRCKESSEMLGGLAISMLAGSEMRIWMKEELDKKREESRARRKVEEEIATMLKTKLLLIRDKGAV